MSGSEVTAHDRGAVAVLVAVWIVVVTVVAGAGAAVLSLVDARVRAASAADLGALAAASEVLGGPDRACGRASSVIRANGASMLSCSVEGVTVRVAASRVAPLGGWFGAPVHVEARARAGLTADGG